MSSLESRIEMLKESHANKLEHAREEKNCVEKEKDFLLHESNTKELQLSDLRSKLKKRSEELQELKEGLNQQI